MTAAPIRLVLAVVATFALGFADSDGCGYTPDDLKGEGEPCTRSSECELTLECRGGVCMPAVAPDAGLPRDGGIDAGPDGGRGADRDASTDAATPDAEVPEADASAADGSVS